MIGEFFYGLILCSLLFAAVLGLVRRGDRLPVAAMLAVSMTFMLLAVWWSNSWARFDGGGDDQLYFAASAVRFETPSDWFDLSQFYDTYEQPGYALLLAWCRQFVGDNLYALKALNVTFLGLTGVVWFAIVREIATRKTALLCLGFILLLPTMFYQASVLHKDLVVAFLQALFLLGIVHYVKASLSRDATLPALALCLSATLALLPFRAPGVWTNIGVAVVSVGAMSMRSASLSRKLWVALVTIGISGGAAAVMTNQSTLSSLGVNDRRAATMASGEIYSTLTAGREAGEGVAVSLSYPLRFLLFDVSAFSLPLSAYREYASWRGLTYLPWIAFGVAPALSGLHFIGAGAAGRAPMVGKADGQELLGRASPLSLVPIMAFLAIYFAQGFLVSDTTRWQTPAAPALSAVAALGVARLRLSRLAVAEAVYLAFLVLGGAAYYALRR